jgi:hypothetical protein
MTQEKTVIRPPKQETEVAQFHGDTPAEGPSPLAQQAAEYGRVARESLEDCQRGAEAEQELMSRRNRPGQ